MQITACWHPQRQEEINSHPRLLNLQIRILLICRRRSRCREWGRGEGERSRRWAGRLSQRQGWVHRRRGRWMRIWGSRHCIRRMRNWLHPIWRNTILGIREMRRKWNQRTLALTCSRVQYIGIRRDSRLLNSSSKIMLWSPIMIWETWVSRMRRLKMILIIYPWSIAGIRMITLIRNQIGMVDLLRVRHSNQQIIEGIMSDSQDRIITR